MLNILIRGKFKGKGKEKSMIDFKKVMEAFGELCKYPRPSGKEKLVSDFLVSWAKEKGLEVFQDDIYNVLIRRPASPGKENLPGIVLQGHMDMVCVRTDDSDHDFSKDPIEMVEDGKMIRAKDTSLGADNGLGVAMGMAIIEDENTDLPMLELLITTDEETGMSGSIGLSDKWLKGKYLINIDSEKEGELTAGCAGMETFFINKKIEREEVEKEYKPYELVFSGLLGGHSGHSIGGKRGNMVKIIFEFLGKLDKLQNVKVESVDIGTFDNVIPSAGSAKVVIKDLDQSKVDFLIEETLKKYEDLDGQLNIQLNDLEDGTCKKAWTGKFLESAVLMVEELPNGLNSMLEELGLPESSSNLALAREEEGKLHLEISLRSASEVKMKEMHNAIATVLDKYEFPFAIGAESPAWAYIEESDLRDKACKVYEDVTGREMKVLVTHGGLECGCIAEKYPHMDMISVGPDIFDVHSIDEHFDVESAERIFKYLQKLLSELD